MKDLIRRYDKGIPVCVKTMHDMFNPYFRISARINTEAVSDLSETLGFDSGTYPFHMCFYDWLRSLSPEKPLMNLEFYAFGPSERTKVAMWKAAIHGVAAADWWCWHPKDTFTSALSKAPSLYHCARETFNIQRLIKEVRAFNRFPRSPFVFLYPKPVIPRCNAYFKAHDAVSYAIRGTGYTIDYVAESRVPLGRLDDYRIAVLPCADYIKDETYQAVVDFVTKGGIALLIGDLPKHDGAGKERDVSSLVPADRAAAGASHQIADDGTAVHIYPSGKGKLYRLENLPASKGKRASAEAIQIAAALIERVISDELPPRPIRIRGCSHRIIRWREDPSGQTWLAFLWNGSRTQEITVHPEYTGPVKTCTDLIAGERMDPDGISVPPYSCRLLRYALSP